MKRNAIKLTVITIVLAIFLAIAMIYAWTASAGVARATVAEGTDVKVEVLEEDGSVSEGCLVVPGEDVTLKITIETTRPGNWNLFVLNIYPLTINKTSGERTINSEQMSLFSDARVTKKNISCGTIASYTESGGLNLQAIVDYEKPTSEAIELEVALKTSSEAECVAIFGLGAGNRKDKVLTGYENGTEIKDEGTGTTLTNSKVATVNVGGTNVKIGIINQFGEEETSGLAIPGEDVTLKLTIETARQSDAKWFASSLYIVPVTVNSANGTHDTNDEEIGSFSNPRITKNNLETATFSHYDEKGYSYGFTGGSEDKYTTSKAVEVEFKLTVADNASGTFVLGLRTGYRLNTLMVLVDGKNVSDKGNGMLTNTQVATIEMCQKNLSINNRVQIDGQQVVRQYAFLYEEFEEDSFGTYSYRRTYQEKGYVHGVDDVSFERIVLGQIDSQTNVMNFLQAFGEKERKMMVIRDNYGEVIYQYGQPGENVTESELADCEMYAIGTGWSIEYGSEVIYTSVLGDIDGDGYVNAIDYSYAYLYINGEWDLFEAATEIRLAAYLANSGVLDSEDIVYLETIIRFEKVNSDYFTIVEEE